MGKRNKKMSRRRAAVMAAVLAAPAIGCTAGFNTLEESVNCADGSARTRAINNIAQEVGGAEISYHGLNQLNDLDGATYSGVQRFMVRGKDGKVRVLVRVCTAGDGSARTMAGARLPNVLGDYGFTDISADQDGANLTVYFGKVIGKRQSLELLHSHNFSFSGAPSAYDEVQYNLKVGRHWDVVARAEVPAFDAKKARWYAGIRCRK